MPRRPGTHRPHKNNAATPKHTTTQERSHEPQRQRGTSASRGYGYKWQQARAGYLAKHPLCVKCEAEGKVVPSTEVDHIIPHKGDMVLFWDRANWQALCKPCHSSKTAREDGGWGKGVVIDGEFSREEPKQLERPLYE